LKGTVVNQRNLSATRTGKDPRTTVSAFAHNDIYGGGTFIYGKSLWGKVVLTTSKSREGFDWSLSVGGERVDYGLDCEEPSYVQSLAQNITQGWRSRRDWNENREDDWIYIPVNKFGVSIFDAERLRQRHEREDQYILEGVFPF
jgi:hypothetical protein